MTKIDSNCIVYPNEQDGQLQTELDSQARLAEQLNSSLLTKDSQLKLAREDNRQDRKLMMKNYF